MRMHGEAMEENRMSQGGRLTSQRTQDYVAVWTVVLLLSGQGFRYLLGIPVYVVLCVVTVTAVVVTMRVQARDLRIPVLLAAYLGVAVATVAWSATRTVTALAIVVLLVTTYVAVACVRRTSPVRFMELLYRGLQISLFGGFAFEVIVALAVRHPLAPLSADLANAGGNRLEGEELLWSRAKLLSGGPIEGFVGNRNPFAAIALFAAITGLVLLMERRIRKADGLTTLAMAAVVHVFTQSATVTVAAVYLAALALAALVIRRVPVHAKKALSFTVLACTAIAAVLTIKFRVEIFAMVDRSGDASHRTEIWRQVIAAAEHRPEGWGFVGYWPIWEQPYAGILDRAGLVATHSHNAFLDAWLQLGLIGLVLLLGMLVLTFGSAWRLVERAGRGDTFVPLGWVMLTAALSLQALTESRLLVEGGWFLLVALFSSAPQVFMLTIVDPEFVHSASLRPQRDVHERAVVAHVPAQENGGGVPGPTVGESG